MTDSRRLNRRIKLQRRVETQTGTGGTAIAWVDIAPVWANIRHPAGMETVRSEFPVSVVKTSIRIRFREDLDATCRVPVRPDS